MFPLPPQNNVFFTDLSIDRRYDLKGSTQGRKLSDKERLERGKDAILKDVDLIEANTTFALGSVKPMLELQLAQVFFFFFFFFFFAFAAVSLALAPTPSLRCEARCDIEKHARTLCPNSGRCVPQRLRGHGLQPPCGSARGAREEGRTGSLQRRSQQQGECT